MFAYHFLPYNSIAQNLIELGAFQFYWNQNFDAIVYSRVGQQQQQQKTQILSVNLTPIRTIAIFYCVYL